MGGFEGVKEKMYGMRPSFIFSLSLSESGSYAGSRRRVL